VSAPTLVSYAATTFSGGSVILSKSVSGVAVQSGDVLVVTAVTEDYNAAKIADVDSGDGAVWTEQQAISTPNNSSLAIYTAPVASAGTRTITVSLVDMSPSAWGFGVYVFRGGSGVGASASKTGTGAPSQTLVTTGANSAVVVVVGDWNAVDGTTRTWRSGAIEKSYFRDAAAYTVYTGVVLDSAAAGSKNEGLSAPTGMTYSIGALEILGSGAAAPTPVANAGADQGDIEPLSTVTLSGSGTNSPTSYAWTQTAGPAVTLSSSTVASPTFTAPANSNGATLTFSLVATNASGSSSPDTVTITVLPHLEWILNGSGVWRPSTTTLL